MSERPFLETFRLRVTPITPVHVGSGELLEPYAYLLRDGELWVLDPIAFLEAVPPEAAVRYLEALEKGPFRAREALLELATRHDLGPAVAWRAPVSEDFQAFVSEALERGRGELGVRIFPRSLKGPYLPGSSLKGALRTVFLFDRSREELAADFDEGAFEWKGERDLRYRGRIWQLEAPGSGRIRIPAGALRGRKALSPNQSFEAFLLGNYLEKSNRGTGSKEGKAEIPRDPFRTLLVGDSSPLPTTAFSVVEVHGSRRRPGQGPTGIRILAETWRKGSVEVDLRIHRGMQEHPGSALHVRRDRDGQATLAPTHPPSLQALAVAAYERYVLLAERELDFYEERGWYRAAREMERVLGVIEKCLDDEGRMRKPYRFPLRLGFGSGELSIRLSEFVEYENARMRRIDPASRKLAEGMPMGWVLVEVLE